MIKPMPTKKPLINRLSPAERAKLHVQLDRLIDQREKLESELESQNAGGLLNRLSPESRTPDAAVARGLVKAGSEIVRSAVGPLVQSMALDVSDDDDGKTTLFEWLRLVAPILESPKETGTSGKIRLSDIFTGLSALRAGEVRPLFQAPTVGRAANIWSLAYLRIIALCLKKLLVEYGIAEGEANAQVSSAFGIGWDTIRKWHGPSETILGKKKSRALLEIIRLSFESNIAEVSERRDFACDFVRTIGQHYKEEHRKSGDAGKGKR